MSLWSNIFSTDGTFIYKGTGTCRRGWGIYKLTTLRFQYSDTFDGYDQTLSVLFATQNKCIHIMMTVDKSSNILTAYINGISVGTLDIIGISDDSDFFGLNLSYQGTAYQNFKGLIDEVRIYSQALSSCQIKKLYVEGAKKRELLTCE